jgi:hypothetical protein
MTYIKWAYKIASGEFTRGGPCEPPYDPATEAVVQLPRYPDARTERYDASAPDRIRPATAEEIRAYDAAQTEERMRNQFDANQLVKALASWTAQRLGVPLAQARQEILTILKTL